MVGQTFAIPYGFRLASYKLGLERDHVYLILAEHRNFLVILGWHQTCYMCSLPLALLHCFQRDFYFD